MSRRRIISPLFTETDRTESGRHRHQIKGGNTSDSTGSSPGRAAQETDVYRIDMKEINSALDRLVKFSDTRIADLPQSIRKDLDNLTETIGIFSSTNYYPELIKVINKNFGNIRTVKVDTVGAVFRGCFVTDEFPGLQSCSAICAGMVPASVGSGSNGFPICTENVFFFDGETLTSQNVTEPRVDRAIIHVTDVTKYVGFKPIHIKQLQEFGIKTVTLYLVDSNNKYTEKLNSQPVVSLPLSSVFASGIQSPNTPTPTPQQQLRQVGQNNPQPAPLSVSDEGGSLWAWILLFVGIIFIIILLVWASNRGRNASCAPGSSTSGYSWSNYGF